MGCLDYMQVLEVPFHWRPAASHALADLWRKSGRSSDAALGDGGSID
jgi:hypothetical protein